MIIFLLLIIPSLLILLAKEEISSVKTSACLVTAYVARVCRRTKHGYWSLLVYELKVN